MISEMLFLRMPASTKSTDWMVPILVQQKGGPYMSIQQRDCEFSVVDFGCGVTS